MIPNPPARHLVQRPPHRLINRIPRRIIRRPHPRIEQKLQKHRLRKLRRPPKPAQRPIKKLQEPRHRIRHLLLPKRRRLCRAGQVLPHRLRQLLALLFNRALLLPIRLRQRLEHLRKRRHPLPRRRRKVRPAPEGPALPGLQKHAHRPPAAPGHHHRRGHIHVIHIRPLFPIHLDAHKIPTHLRCNRLVLKTLPLHHVAPVARRIPNRQKHRHPAPPRLRKRLIPPPPPLHRIVRMLQQIRTRLINQPIGLACVAHSWVFDLWFNTETQSHGDMEKRPKRIWSAKPLFVFSLVQSSHPLLQPPLHPVQIPLCALRVSASPC